MNRLNLSPEVQLAGRIPWLYIAVPLLCILLLVGVSRTNYLLFHTLAELFAVMVAVLLGVIAWQTYHFSRNNYLMYMGCGYLWIGVLDLLHTMSFQGMGIVNFHDPGASIQFWIATRYLEAVLLLSAPYFLSATLKPGLALAGYGLATLIACMLIVEGYFPRAYVPGLGLTQFKIYSEYAIMALLAIAVVYLWRRRALLAAQVRWMMSASILLTIVAEFVFTAYLDPYDTANLVGHIVKIISYWLIFLAVVRTTLAEPFAMLARGAQTYDAVPDAVIVVDSDGVVREANPAALRVAGCSEAELVGRHCHALFHPPSTEMAQCPVCRHVSRAQATDAIELSWPDGSWREFRLSGIDAPSGLHGMVHVMRDVTGRKCADQQLLTLSRSLEQSPGMVMITDPQGRIEFINHSLVTVTGYQPEDLIGKTSDELQAQGIRLEIHNALCAAIKAGGLQRRLVDDHDRQGAAVWVAQSVSPVVDESGERAHYIAVMENITERRRLTDELARTENEWVQAMDFFEDAVYLLDLDDRLLRANKAFYRLRGLQPEQALGRNIMELMHPGGEDMPCPVCLARQQRRDAYITMEASPDTPFEQPVEVMVRMIRDEQGEPKRVLMAIRDLTRTRQIEAELRRYRHQLEELVAERTAELEMSNRELEAFSYSVSHDLRAPLRGIDGFSQILLEDFGAQLDESGREYLRRVRSNSQRMGSLIDDLLMLSRVSRRELSNEPVNLSVLAEKILADLQSEQPDRPAKFRVGPDLIVRGDRSLLQLAMLNLLNNAWKYSSHRDQTEISFSGAEERGERVFSVEDNGVGFDMQYAGKLFQPFQRLHGSGEFEGSGIGLATVRRIVERHGGRIWAESSLRGGARFSFTLPGTTLQNSSAEKSVECPDTVSA